MKRLESYNDAELAKFTEKDIADLVDFECAHEGIRLVPPKPVKPIDGLPEPDVTVYKISEIRLTDYTEAQQLINLANNCKSKVTVDWRSSYNRRYISGRQQDINYKERKYYSEKLYEDIATDIACLKERKEAYENLESEYKNILRDRDAIAKKVEKAIQESKRKDQRVARLKTEFHRYVQLAEGNQTIAWKFLMDARKDEHEYLLKLKPIIAMERMRDATTPKIR